MTDIDGGAPGSVIDLIVDGGGPGVDVVDVFDGNTLDIIVPPFPSTPPILSREDSRTLWLESLDGSIVLPLNVDVDRILRAGATGLQLPPLDVVTATTPGMPGSWLQETSVLEREVFLPLEFASDSSHQEFLAKLKELRGLIAGAFGTVDIGSTGTFRLGASSVHGERLLDVTYKSGWEGAWGGSDSGTRWEKFGLTLVAVDPFFRAREYTEYRYEIADGEVFIGSGDGTNPWPRRLAPSVSLGSDMRIPVTGEVPVWIEMIVDGPATVASIQFPGTNIAMTSAVADGAELVLVTDPRKRSARLNGAVAWSKITMASTFAPLLPGVNTINVQLSASSDGTAMTMRWLEGFLSAW